MPSSALACRPMQLIQYTACGGPVSVRATFFCFQSRAIFVSIHGPHDSRWHGSACGEMSNTVTGIRAHTLRVLLQVRNVCADAVTAKIAPRRPPRIASAPTAPPLRGGRRGALLRGTRHPYAAKRAASGRRTRPALRRLFRCVDDPTQHAMLRRACRGAKGRHCTSDHRVPKDRRKKE